MTNRGKAVIGVALVSAIALTIVFIFSRASAPLPSPSAAACHSGACATATCPPGFRPETKKGECCPTCVPERASPVALDRCGKQPCAACPAGTRADPRPGECCPRCISEAEKPCVEGQARYEERFAELERELRTCSADADCIYASFGNACRANCPMPLNKLKLGPVVERLRQEAESSCGDCTVPPFECVHGDVTTVACVSSRCELSAQ